MNTVEQSQPLYLPISGDIVQKICDDNDIRLSVQGLDAVRLASILTIQVLPAMDSKLSPDKAHRDLDSVFSLVHKQLLAADAPLASFMQAYDRETFITGLALIDTFGIAWVITPGRNIDDPRDPKLVVETSDFVHAALSEKISSNYPSHTEQQFRVIAKLAGNLDDTHHVQGFAGTGKTRTAIEWVNKFPIEGSLLLTLSRAQGEAFVSRLEREPAIQTFGELAFTLLSTNLVGSVRQMVRTKRWGLYRLTDQIHAMMQCLEVGDYDSDAVARILFAMVKKFCYSADQHIKVEHIPEHIVFKTAVDKKIMAGMANTLWEKICKPEKKTHPPLTAYHLVKALALTQITIPEKYTHIIVDEAHDISKPMMQVLKRSPQSLFVFGDSYQALSGLSSLNWHNYAHYVMNHQLSISMRSGDRVAHTVNTVLSYHPTEPSSEYRGSKRFLSKINYYDSFSIPDHPCTVLTRDNWRLFEVALNLSEKNGRYSFLGRSLSELEKLIGSAITFFKKEQPNHRYFSRYGSWEEYVETQSSRFLFNLHARFEDGFEHADLSRVLKRAQRGLSADVYRLGRVEDAKNMEFDRVALTEDLLTLGSNTKKEKASIINHIYMGLTRARYELNLPGYMEDWLKDNV